MKYLFFSIVAIAISFSAMAERTMDSITERRKTHVVFLISKDKDNYEADRTIPEFAAQLQKTMNIKTTVLLAEGQRTAASFPGIEKELAKADLLVVFARRLALPAAQMDAIRAYIKKGKPVVGIRTANHAFSVHDADKQVGYVDWWDFVLDVMGCMNRGYGPVEPGTDVSKVQSQRQHVILEGIPDNWHSKGNLYHVAVDEKATLLLKGRVGNDVDPVAWTRISGKSRVFYTSLGYPDDFSDPAFIKLLTNGIEWALQK